MVSRKAWGKKPGVLLSVRSRLFGRWRQARLFTVAAREVGEGEAGGEFPGRETRRVAKKGGERGKEGDENQQNEREKGPAYCRRKATDVHVDGGESIRRGRN